MIARAALLAGVILTGGVYGLVTDTPDRPVARTPLRLLPCEVEQWRCAEDTPFDARTLAVLGVDDYVNRSYRSGSEAIGLYIGYYGSQRQGESIHSPQNCLPGSGWQPVSAARTSIATGAGVLPLNRYVIQKDLDRQVVLYWYQGRGRVVANEYVNKLWLMLDQATLHRSDGALVRIVAPVDGLDARALAAASTSAEAFARGIQPRLSLYLP